MRVAKGQEHRVSWVKSGAKCEAKKKEEWRLARGLSCPGSLFLAGPEYIICNVK
jgi:hypothetical protein